MAKLKYYPETKTHPRNWKIGRVMIVRSLAPQRPYNVYLRDRFITHRDTLDDAKKVAQLIHNG